MTPDTAFESFDFLAHEVVDTPSEPISSEASLHALGYATFRGRCKELSEAACQADPTLTLVRGHYHCPIWGTKEAHWWTVRPDGTIHDPTKLQFPSGGLGEYVPFDGTIECDECGKVVPEDEAQIHGRYAFCSGLCNARFVGLI